jgi:hypothetical protein
MKKERRIRRKMKKGDQVRVINVERFPEETDWIKSHELKYRTGIISSTHKKLNGIICFVQFEELHANIPFYTTELELIKEAEEENPDEM